MLVILNYIFLILFVWGLYGLIINRNNLIQIIISFEVIILALILNLASTTIFSSKINGVAIILMVIIIAASETALGLTLVVSLNKIKGTISTLLFNLSK